MANKLIIVCDETEKKYATYLQQLVSANDDDGETQIGTKDGTVSATIYSEKQYEDNLIKTASTNHVLFIGDNKLAKNARANMEEKYSNFGMHYGWLGKQAFMYANPSEFDKNKADSFYELCTQYKKSFEKAIEAGKKNPLALEQAYKDAHGIAKAAIGAVRIALGRIDVIAGMVADLTIDILQKKEIRDQQYTMLTLILYMDGLSKFLEA